MLRRFYNETQHPPFSEKHQALTGLLKSVFQTHRPTWDNCQQLLLILFTTEKKGKIRQEALKAIIGPGQGKRFFSLYLTPMGPQHLGGGCHQALNTFHRYLIEGVWEMAHKPTKFSEVGTVTQGPQELLAAFLERLLDAYYPEARTISGPSIWLLFPSLPQT